MRVLCSFFASASLARAAACAAVIASAVPACTLVTDIDREQIPDPPLPPFPEVDAGPQPGLDAGMPPAGDGGADATTPLVDAAVGDAGDGGDAGDAGAPDASAD